MWFKVKKKYFKKSVNVDDYVMFRYFDFDFIFRCLLCKAESQLQVYESLLFSISNKQKNISIDKAEVKDDETVYESTSKGFWKMSQKEFLLMSQL